MRRAYGFTIVELLIVIVVIAILAALSYVGYTNISQRANNATIISVASQSIKAIKASIAETGEYPYAFSYSAYACITGVPGCYTSGGGVVSGRSVFDNRIASIGTLPAEVPAIGDGSGGAGVMTYY